MAKRKLRPADKLTSELYQMAAELGGAEAIIEALWREDLNSDSLLHALKLVRTASNRIDPLGEAIEEACHG